MVDERCVQALVIVDNVLLKLITSWWIERRLANPPSRVEI
jgi:hypothetical protein